MARVRIKYIQTWVDRKTGRTYCYFRKRGCPRVELPGPLGSDAFWSAYRRAEKTTASIGSSPAGSVSAALAAYYQSRQWAALSEGTRNMRRGRKRRGILEIFRALYGELPLRKMHTEFIETYLDTLSAHAAKNTLKALRGFLRHAKHDVTAGIKITAKSQRYHTWTAEEIAQFEFKFPVGSKARLCFALAKYTGAATSDIARMQLPRGGEICGERTKTGVAFGPFPVHPELQRIIEATPSGHLTLLVTNAGRAYHPNHLSNRFREWCDEAGLPQRCVIHGLRHHMGAQLAERGRTTLQIAAVLGHSSTRMAEHYTKEASRKRLSRDAMKGMDEDA